MGFDFAQALNKEVLALVEAGCKYIQVDEPVFARKPEESYRVWNGEFRENNAWYSRRGATRLSYMLWLSKLS